jgi:hypothetical protein
MRQKRYIRSEQKKPNATRNETRRREVLKRTRSCEWGRGTGLTKMQKREDGKKSTSARHSEIIKETIRDL